MSQNRRCGGQPGNENAITHGRHSRRRRAERAAEAAERAQQHREWMQAIPKTDYRAICAAIEASAATKN